MDREGRVILVIKPGFSFLWKRLLFFCMASSLRANCLAQRFSWKYRSRVSFFLGASSSEILIWSASVEHYNFFSPDYYWLVDINCSTQPHLEWIPLIISCFRLFSVIKSLSSKTKTRRKWWTWESTFEGESGVLGAQETVPKLSHIFNHGLWQIFRKLL
jgi:hypothetical protein